MLSIPPMLGPVAAVVGALAAWTGVTVTVLIFLWNKLDKRFDELKVEMQGNRAELKAEMREYRAEVKTELQEHRAEVKAEMREHRAEVKTEMQENRAEVRALREAVLSMLSVNA